MAKNDMRQVTELAYGTQVYYMQCVECDHVIEDEWCGTETGKRSHRST